MTVTHVTGSVSRNAGGLFTSVRRLVESLHDREDASVNVIGLRDERTIDDIEEWRDDVRPTALSVVGPARWGYAPRLQRAIRDTEPDIVHVHGIWMYTSMVSGRYGRRTETPYLITPRGMLDPWAITHSGWKKKLAGWLFENRNMSKAACLHALCRREAKAIRSYGLETPVCEVPNAVDLPVLSEQGEDCHSRKFGDQRVLLFLGRIHPKKGLRELIEAWEGLSEKQRKGWVVAVVGWDDGGFEKKLKEEVQKRGLQEEISFLGPRFGAEKEAMYRRADAFVLPSHGEGLPMTILEAWSYQLPVLMTPECNLEIGFDRGAALQADPTSSSLKAGLRRLFALSEEERQQMAEEGRALVEERFTWKRVAEDMSRVYQWILDGGTPPANVSLH